MIGSLFTLAAVMKFAHAAFMGTPTAHALAAKEAPLAMLIPMGALPTASVVFGLFPGLLLVPIAAIEGELGFAPITASLLGPLPGLEGWSPLLLTALTADLRHRCCCRGCGWGAALRSCAATSICAASSTSPPRTCGRAQPGSTRRPTRFCAAPCSRRNARAKREEA